MTKKRGILTLAFTALMTTVTLIVVAAPAQAATTPIRKYEPSGPTAYCLDVATENNRTVQLYKCSGGREQSWSETSVSVGGGSYFEFTNQNTRGCLGIAGGSADAGVGAESRPCGTDDTNWSVYYANNTGLGWYQVLQNKHSNLCLNLFQDNVANRGVIEQQPCAVATSMFWLI